MQRLAIPVLVVLGLCLAACGGSDEAEQIHGTWVWEAQDAYETFESNGNWSVSQGVYSTPFDWGTYTLEDGILTMLNAYGSYCDPDDSAVYEVAFSEDGNELSETVVSESCSNYSVRGVDRVLVRYTP